MQEIDYDSALEGIIKKDSRYGVGAYQFVREALEFTMDRMGSSELDSRSEHVSGQQLLLGARDYALEQYGPMVLTVFEEWGFERCEDIGEVVYNLIDAGLFGKNEKDEKDDFSSIYEFEEAFAQPFLPRARRPEDQGYGGRIGGIAKQPPSLSPADPEVEASS